MELRDRRHANDPRLTFVGNAVGLTVRTTKSRPHLRGVVLGREGLLLRSFEYLCNDDEDHEMVYEVGRALTTELAAQPVDAVVIREAGYAKGSGLRKSDKNRLRAEGYAVGVARTFTIKVRLIDSAGIGHLLGTTAVDADSRGTALIKDDYAKSATAALGALTL